MEVKVWEEQVAIPTYSVGAPDKNPMFFEKRVYQGSSGVVYPNPVIEKIADEKVDKEYIGLFLENDYLKIMVLPEIGGRIQTAYDKIAKRHFIYHNRVIKPALVGLCGPWISGGIEFNWPQHHRPGTFEPVDYQITENADGSKTIWVNEVEKMFRTKGMAAFTLYPDKAYLEIKARLYNRTNLPQTFLWWANPAVKVNDDYQSVFPPDVNAVFDHGKRDVSTFPIATGTYYKVDYSPGTDISRYKNIPVPTSYMAVNSAYDFVGGYEHDTKGGVLHVADHHVSPGKKQWTWGHGDFGRAWDRNLTDEDGPYIELMTGMYTDNQPDFSWLMPNEEKSFTQYFMPYRNVGLVKNATKDILVGLEKEGKVVNIKVFATSLQEQLSVVAKNSKHELFRQTITISPESLFEGSFAVATGDEDDDISLFVFDNTGKLLISHQPENDRNTEIPEPAKPVMLPAEIATNEQLFLAGQHLEQYRHATYSPVPYYEEALKREAGDIRNNNALGVWYLRRGQFKKSEDFFRRAISSITKHNPNPYDGEPYYNLSLSLRYRDKTDQAYEAFFKSTWNSAWQDSGYFEVAKIDLLRKNYVEALEHIDWSLDRNARNGKAYLAKIHALRKLDRIGEAIRTATIALEKDGFNISALFELYFCYFDTEDDEAARDVFTKLARLSRGSNPTLIESAIEYAELGLFAEAIELLATFSAFPGDPMLNYYIGYYWYKAGDRDSAGMYFKKAAAADPGYTFPNRLEDILVLTCAIASNPTDAKALYYLGNLWYDKRQYDDAIKAWERSMAIDKDFPTVLRNLAIAAFNKQNDPGKALNYFERAFSLDPTDTRVLMELDQLYKRLNYPVQKRQSFLERHSHTAFQRDDVYLEIAALKNLLGNYSEALEMIMTRKFHPWEGGEGKVSGQYTHSLVQLARADIRSREYKMAIEKLIRAQTYPENLGEGKLPGAQENDIFYWLGDAFFGLGDFDLARLYWEKATVGPIEPAAAMFYNDQQPDKIFYQGLAWERLGNPSQASQICENLVQYGNTHQDDEVRIDYFAVSLPDLLIFEDDLKKRNYLHCRYIAALGHLGKRNFELAGKLLEEVLSKDVSHAGAIVHLQLLHELKDASLNAINKN